MTDRPAEPALDVRLWPSTLLCVAVGGALGALARYGAGRAIHTPPDGFPRATFVINLLGAFVLGAFLTFVHQRPFTWTARFGRPLFAIGFLGAFTTFSTMAVETVTLVKDGHAALGIAYLLVSVALGLAVCVVGVAAARVALRVRSA